MTIAMLSSRVQAKSLCLLSRPDRTDLRRLSYRRTAARRDLTHPLCSHRVWIRLPYETRWPTRSSSPTEERGKEDFAPHPLGLPLELFSRPDRRGSYSAEARVTQRDKYSTTELGSNSLETAAAEWVSDQSVGRDGRASRPQLLLPSTRVATRNAICLEYAAELLRNS
jgi:hypothetical protein